MPSGFIVKRIFVWLLFYMHIRFHVFRREYPQGTHSLVEKTKSTNNLGGGCSLMREIGTREEVHTGPTAPDDSLLKH